MNLATADLVVLVAYLLVITLTGLYFSRKNTSTEEYFVGGRSFSGWVIGLSMIGTSISSITFLAYPGDAFKTTWLRFAPNMMLPVGVLIAAVYFLPFFRRGQITSAYEFLEQRFGPSVRIYGAVAFILGQLVRVSMILYLLTLMLHEITGMETWLCVIVGGVFVGFYTVSGGIDAVVWTDVLQTLILGIGGLVCFYMIVDRVPGGLPEIMSVAKQAGKLSFAEWNNGALGPVSWSLSLQHKTLSMMLLIGLSAWLTEYSSNQNVIQRYCASKSTVEARKAMLFCVAGSLPLWAFYMFLGTSLFVFYQLYPTAETGAMLDGSLAAEQVLPYFIMHELPAGFAGLLIAAALAAAMSSLDSSINAVATVWVVDIYRRHLRPAKSDRHYLKMAWLAAIITAGLMIAGALYLLYTPTQTLQHTATIMVSLLSGGMLGLYLLGFFTRTTDSPAIWTGICATAMFTAWTIASRENVLPEFLSAPFDLYYTGLIGNLVMVGLAYCVGRRKSNPTVSLEVLRKSG